MAVSTSPVKVRPWALYPVTHTCLRIHTQLNKIVAKREKLPKVEHNEKLNCVTFGGGEGEGENESKREREQKG